MSSASCSSNVYRPAKKETIEVALAEGGLADLPFVAADADRRHQSFRAKLLESAVAAVHGRAEVRLLKSGGWEKLSMSWMKSMSKRSSAQALKAVLEGPHRGVVAVVMDDLERRRINPDVHVDGGSRHRLQQAPDLRRKNILVARMPAEQFTETMLGETMAVQRRRVEIAEACIPGRR